MTHAPIDWRLSCYEPGDHHWDDSCAHKQDPTTHVHRCCRHDYSPAVGQWARRQRGDRSEQSSAWHIIKSVNKNRAVMRCGRSMKRLLRWKYPTKKRKLRTYDQLEITTRPYGMYGTLESFRKCRACDSSTGTKAPT